MTCPHARPSWQSCPHCLGVNDLPAPVPAVPPVRDAQPTDVGQVLTEEERGFVDAAHRALRAQAFGHSVASDIARLLAIIDRLASRPPTEGPEGLSEEECTEGLALLAEATAGPWGGGGCGPYGLGEALGTHVDLYGPDGSLVCTPSNADARLICWLRNNAPRLVPSPPSVPDPAAPGEDEGVDRYRDAYIECVGHWPPDDMDEWDLIAKRHLSRLCGCAAPGEEAVT